MKHLIILLALLTIGCAAPKPSIRHECELLRLRTEHLMEYDQKLNLYMEQASAGLITPSEAVSAMRGAALVFQSQCILDSALADRKGKP